MIHEGNSSLSLKYSTKDNNKTAIKALCCLCADFIKNEYKKFPFGALEVEITSVDPSMLQKS